MFRRTKWSLFFLLMARKIEPKSAALGKYSKFSVFRNPAVNFMEMPKAAEFSNTRNSALLQISFIP